MISSLLQLILEIETGRLLPTEDTIRLIAVQKVPGMVLENGHFGTGLLEICTIPEDEVILGI